MKRRGFLGGRLASCAAPAIVRAASIRTVNPAVDGQRIVRANRPAMHTDLLPEGAAWWDPSDLSTVFQDAAGTIPARIGDPVGMVRNKLRAGHGDLIQRIAADRP